jgi:hypothetical protein
MRKRISRSRILTVRSSPDQTSILEWEQSQGILFSLEAIKEDEFTSQGSGER